MMLYLRRTSLSSDIITFLMIGLKKKGKKISRSCKLFSKIRHPHFTAIELDPQAADGVSPLQTISLEQRGGWVGEGVGEKLQPRQVVKLLWFNDEIGVNKWNVRCSGILHSFVCMCRMSMFPYLISGNSTPMWMFFLSLLIKKNWSAFFSLWICTI